MNSNQLIINRISQNIIPFAEGLQWFVDLEETEQISVLQDLRICYEQSHPTDEVVALGLKKSKLKSTFTPCVLILKFPTRQALAKIMELPKGERIKSFCLLISLFSIADKVRSDKYCKDGCSHEWHNFSTKP